MQITYILPQLAQAASTFWTQAHGSRVIAFHGKMGAGKTTFIRALCNELAIGDIVTSPTFSIINEYSFSENGEQKKIFHIDLYRLNDVQEAIRAGIEDCIYGGDTCFIEWPEKIASLLPTDTLHVFMEPVDNQTRTLRIGDN